MQKNKTKNGTDYVINSRGYEGERARRPISHANIKPLLRVSLCRHVFCHPHSLKPLVSIYSLHGVINDVNGPHEFSDCNFGALNSGSSHWRRPDGPIIGRMKDHLHSVDGKELHCWYSRVCIALTWCSMSLRRSLPSGGTGIRPRRLEADSGACRGQHRHCVCPDRQWCMPRSAQTLRLLRQTVVHVEVSTYTTPAQKYPGFLKKDTTI